MASNRTFFVTFGSAHLENFRCDPMRTIVYGTGTDVALRTEVVEIIGSNAFCTSYPYSEASDFVDNYGCTAYSIEELKALRINCPNSDIVLQDFWILSSEYKIEYVGKFSSAEYCEEELGDTVYCALLNDLEFKAMKKSIHLLPNQGD